jgi:hypothetical protein
MSVEPGSDNQGATPSMTVSLPTKNIDANGELIVQFLNAAQASLEHNWRSIWPASQQLTYSKSRGEGCHGCVRAVSLYVLSLAGNNHP